MTTFLTPVDSNWNLVEAATSSFAATWESKVWVRLPHASAKSWNGVEVGTIYRVALDGSNIRERVS